MDKDGLEATLSRIVENLNREFNELTYVDAGALFREHVYEYASAIFKLIQTLDFNADIQDGNADRNIVCQTSRRLCELSREALFSADDESLSQNCVTLVSELLKLSVTVVDFACKHPAFGDLEELPIYLKNIEKRALPNPWDSISRV